MSGKTLSNEETIKRVEKIKRMKKLNKWDRGYAVAVVAQERETAQKLWILSEEHRNGRHHNEDGTPSRVADCPACRIRTRPTGAGVLA